MDNHLKFSEKNEVEETAKVLTIEIPELFESKEVEVVSQYCPEKVSDGKELEVKLRRIKVKIESLKNSNEEISLKLVKYQSLEESGAKAQKLQDLLTTQIFLADRENENLQNLLNSPPEKLLRKYEKIMTTKSKPLIKQEQSKAIVDMKVKLQFQSEQNQIYEKQQSEILNILDIPITNQPLVDILSAIRELKKYEENEIVNYSNAEAFLESCFVAKKESL